MKIKPTPCPPSPRRILRRLVPRKTLHARAAANESEVDDYENEAEPNMKLSHAFIVVLVLHVLAVGGVFAFNTLKTRQIIPDRSAKTSVASKPEARQEPAIKKEVTPANVPEVATKPLANPKPLSNNGATHTVAPGDTLTRIATQHKTSVEAIEQANEITSGSTIRVGQVLSIPSGIIAKTTPAPIQSKPVTANPPVTSKVSETKITVPPKSVETKSQSESSPKAAAPAAKEVASTYVVAKGDNPYSIAKKLKVSYSELIKVNKIEDPTKLQIGQKLIIP